LSVASVVYCQVEVSATD